MHDLTDFEAFILKISQVLVVMPIILTTWEAEIGRVSFQGQLESSPK
jgi:hypothetical protein